MKRGKDRPVTDVERAAMVAARRKGLKLSAIAYDLGRHVSTVSRIAVLAGVSKWGSEIGSVTRGPTATDTKQG